MNRRTLLTGLAGIATVHSIGADAFPAIKAPRRNLLSFGLRSSEPKVIDVDQLSTYSLTLPLEAACSAIRVAVGNVSSQSFEIGGIAVCETDGWNAAKDARWKALAFSDLSRRTGREPRGSFVVPGNRVGFSGPEDLLTLHWSDWIEYTTMASGRPQLLFRILVPAQRMPMSYPGRPGNIASLLPLSAARIVDQAVTPGDYVSAPSDLGKDSEPSPVSPIFVVQYRTEAPGIQIVVGGDSHFSSWDMFAVQAALNLSSPSFPVTVWNAAWSAQPSRRFLPALDAAIEYGQPSISVIQGWTANDGMRADADERYLGALGEVVARTQQCGGLPIVVKGLPRNLYGKNELASWQHINRELDLRWKGCTVFDPDQYVEDAEHPGNWKPGLSGDGIHPDRHGNSALRSPFEEILREMI